MKIIGHISLAHGEVEEHQFLTLIQRESVPGAVPVTFLDLTQSCLNINITLLRHLESLTSLETIVLDKNELDSLIGFPPIPSLRCLWVNNNCISDLVKCIDDVSCLFPSLEELSMLRNPACPGYMDIKQPDHDSIKMFRTYVVWRLPRLRVVNGINVTDVEKVEAKYRGPLAITHRPLGKELGGVDGEKRYRSHGHSYYKAAKRATMKAYHKASAWMAWALDDTVVEVKNIYIYLLYVIGWRIVFIHAHLLMQVGHDPTGLQPKPKGFPEERRNSQRQLTIVTRRSEYSGHHSEGNRYIKDDEL